MWRWPYLEDPKFYVRHRIAAKALRRCSRVIEVGGGKTSISPYIQAEYLGFEEDSPLDPENLPMVDSGTGVVILGIDALYPGVEELCLEASTLVLEWADEHSIPGLDELLWKLGDPDAIFHLDLGDEKYNQRTLCVWSAE